MGKLLQWGSYNGLDRWKWIWIYNDIQEGLFTRCSLGEVPKQIKTDSSDKMKVAQFFRPVFDTKNIEKSYEK